MYGGLIKRMSQTLKEFKLWEGKAFNTKMEKVCPHPQSCFLQSGDHIGHSGRTVCRLIDCELIYKAARIDGQVPMLCFLS